MVPLPIWSAYMILIHNDGNTPLIAYSYPHPCYYSVIGILMSRQVMICLGHRIKELQLITFVYSIVVHAIIKMVMAIEFIDLIYQVSIRCCCHRYTCVAICIGSLASLLERSSSGTGRIWWGYNWSRYSSLWSPAATALNGRSTGMILAAGGGYYNDYVDVVAPVHYYNVTKDEFVHQDDVLFGGGRRDIAPAILGDWVTYNCLII